MLANRFIVTKMMANIITILALNNVVFANKSNLYRKMFANVSLLYFSSGKAQNNASVDDRK
jgi:hypothetical protein